MPWNFPLWQAIRCAVPLLLAGNGVLLKPAPNVLRSGGLEFEDLLEQACLSSSSSTNAVACPLRTLLVSANRVGSLLADHRVRGVSLTGSERAGRAAAAAAGWNLKRFVVELGGNDAYIVLEDADLQHAASTIVKARMLNAGQSCIGPKRIIPVGSKERAESLEKLLVEEVKKTTENGNFPPLVHAAARRGVAAQVQSALDTGKGEVRCVYHAELASSSSGDAFYGPTILAGLSPESPAWDQEIFGPVISVSAPASSVKEAVKLHNLSSFGLGGGLFTAGAKSQEKATEEILDAMSAGIWQ